MDMSYLLGRLNKAKAADADIVKVDIEEFESFLDAIEKYSQKWAEAYNQGKKDTIIKMSDCIHRTQDAFKEFISLLEAESPLTAKKIDITKAKIDVYDMEVDLEEDRLSFRYELVFDVDKYFGTDTQSNPRKWVNFYTYWSPENGVMAAYEIDSDDDCETLDWDLTKEEKRFFLLKMEECCKEASGKNLNDFWNGISDENEV